MSDAPSTLQEAAVWYCENGLKVFPCHERTKKPATKHGLNDNYGDPEQAEAIWERFPKCNIGIVCGTASGGLLVLDFDEDDEKGVHGLDTLNDWEDTHGELPPTATAITGRGGVHMLYRTGRTNIHPSANAELGVDVRCEGSYIVAPPSVHPNGSIYRWQDGCAPWECGIADADDNVYDLLDHVQRNGGAMDGAPERKAFELPDRIRKGERDTTLYKYACSLYGRRLPDDAIEAMVAKENAGRCDEPLTAGEIRRIIASAAKRGYGHDGAERPLDEGGIPGAFGSKAKGQIRTPRGKLLTNELAKCLIEQNHARHIDGALAVWTGRRWEYGKGAISRLCLDYADDATVQQKNEVYGYLHDKAPFVTSDKGFDGRYYIQFCDCTWDVLAMERVEPEPSMLITATLPVALDTDAEANIADRFIHDIADGDEATEDVLCEIIGACMCCRRVLSQSPMLIGRAGVAGGEAANGKSTYLNTLRSLLGSENTSSLDIATLGQRFQAGRVVGKLANLGDDIPDGFLRGEELSMFKRLVTGDAIYTDVKNAEGFEFRPSATFVFSMNAMPRLADTTDGVFRRLAFVPFRRRFMPGDGGYDPDILSKLTDDAALRRFALLGLMRLPSLIQRGSLTAVPEMVEEIESIRIDNDVVRRWAYEEGITEEFLDGRWTDEVFADFKLWARDAGERYAVSQRGFTKRVLAAFGRLRVQESRARAAKKRGYKFKVQV